MKTYHPPMTGLETHMEEEIARQAHRTDEALAQAQQARPQRKRTPARVTKFERETEEAMVLGQ